MFGHTNTLLGGLWAKAFTDALRTKTPEWWNSGNLIKSNVNLLTRDGRTVLVVPEAMALEFREKGFKEFQWEDAH